MKVFFYLCIAGLIFSSCSSSPQQESDKTHEWTFLIKDGGINTWKTHGDVKTEVKGDILEVSGNAGGVFSEQAYSDFLFETLSEQRKPANAPLHNFHQQPMARNR